MDSKLLKSVLERTESNPRIEWNDDSLLELIKDDNVYNVFIFNKDGNHGYFSFFII